MEMTTNPSAHQSTSIILYASGQVGISGKINLFATSSFFS